MNFRGAAIAVFILVCFGLLFIVLRSVHHTLVSYGGRTNTQKALLDEIHARELGPWYIDYGDEALSRPSKAGNVRIGKDGVPVVRYGDKTEYNPVTVAKYAFELYNSYISHPTADRRSNFLRQADWLARYCRPACLYSFAHPPQIYSAKWVSGMAEGEVISVQLRAYQLTHRNKYLIAAREAFGVLSTPLEKGGPLVRTPHGVWFEEYPQVPPTHVLNGHMFALFGLWDYYKITKDPVSRTLFYDGVAAATDGLAMSDTGYWARYDLAHVALCSRPYMDLEIQQIRILDTMMQGSSLPAIAARFEQYESSPYSFLRIWMHDIRYPRGLYETQGE